VGGCVVVVKEPVVIVPKFGLFCHTFSLKHLKTSESKSRVDHSVRRNKFTVNNPLHVKKKQ
jgi:hypothetical protein